MLEGDLSVAQEAAKKSPSHTLRALVERLRNQLAIKEKQQRVHKDDTIGAIVHSLSIAQVIVYPLLPAVVLLQISLQFLIVDFTYALPIPCCPQMVELLLTLAYYPGMYMDIPLL